MFRVQDVMKNLLVTLAFAMLIATCNGQQIMLDDFDSPPQFAAEVNGTAQYNVWIPTAYNNGTTVDTTTTVQANTCLKYMDWDTVRANGIYKIYPSAFPATGQYRIRIRLRIYDTYSPSDYGSYTNFVLGYKVNGTHRNAMGEISPKPLPTGEYVTIPLGYLTPGNDNGKDFIEIISQPFSANAGDNLRVLMSSHTDFSTYHKINNSDSYLLLEDLRLDPNTVPVALSNWSLE